MMRDRVLSSSRDNAVKTISTKGCEGSRDSALLSRESRSRHWAVGICIRFPSTVSNENYTDTKITLPTKKNIRDKKYFTFLQALFCKSFDDNFFVAL